MTPTPTVLTPIECRELLRITPFGPGPEDQAIKTLLETGSFTGPDYITSWGEATSFQMAVGYKLGNQLTPVMATVPEAAKQVVAGIANTFVVTWSGHLYVTGGNSYGTLGQGDRGANTFGGFATFFMLVPLVDVVEVAVSGGAVIALKGDGTVRAWGPNFYGHLGVPGTQGREEPGFKTATPQLVPGLPPLKSITMGGSTCAGVDFNNRVWAWGQDKGGQCARGDAQTERLPGESTLLKDVEVTKVAIGGSYNQPGHLLALTTSKTVLAVGAGKESQLGNGIAESSLELVQVSGLLNVIDIATDIDHSVAITGDLRAHCWGRGREGQIGDGTLEDKAVPVEVPGLANVTSADVGWKTTLAACTDGSTFAWGNNTPHGELGDGTTVNKPTPTMVPGVAAKAVSAGRFHSSVIGTGPSPNMSATADEHSVTTQWVKPGADTGNWKPWIRPVTKPTSSWSPELKPNLPKGTRSYTVGSYQGVPLIPGQLYEVRISSPDFPGQVLRITTAGVPLLVEEEEEAPEPIEGV